MRIPLVLLMLGLTASCAWQPVPQAATAPAPTPVAVAGPTPLVPSSPSLTAPPPSPIVPPPPPAAVAAVPPPAPAAPVATAPAPAPQVATVSTPGAGPIDYRPIPLLWLPLLQPMPPTGRLTLSNFNFESARVQALVTANPDCAVTPGAVVSDFVMPLNATRVIPAPAGTDVCWRRQLPASPAIGEAPPVPQQWSPWNRAFTSTGRFLDSQL